MTNLIFGIFVATIGAAFTLVLWRLGVFMGQAYVLAKDSTTSFFTRYKSKGINFCQDHGGYGIIRNCIACKGSEYGS